MKDFIPAIVGCILVIGSLIGIIAISNGLDDVKSEQNWNKGQCEICNKQWELYQITSRYGKGTRYFYIDSKGHMFESSLYFNDKENK